MTENNVHQCLDCDRQFISIADFPFRIYDIATHQPILFDRQSHEMLAIHLGIPMASKHRFQSVGENDVAMDQRSSGFQMKLSNIVKAKLPGLETRIMDWFDPNSVSVDPNLWNEINERVFNNKICDGVHESTEDGIVPSTEFHPECPISGECLSRATKGGLAIIFFVEDGQDWATVYSKESLLEWFKNKPKNMLSNPMTNERPVDNQLISLNPAKILFHQVLNRHFEMDTIEALNQLLASLAAPGAESLLATTDDQRVLVKEFTTLFDQFYTLVPSFGNNTRYTIPAAELQIFKNASVSIVPALIALPNLMLEFLSSGRSFNVFLEFLYIYGYILTPDILQRLTVKLIGLKKESLVSLLSMQLKDSTFLHTVYRVVKDPVTLRLFTDKLIGFDSKTFITLLTLQAYQQWRTTFDWIYMYVENVEVVTAFTIRLFVIELREIEQLNPRLLETVYNWYESHHQIPELVYVLVTLTSKKLDHLLQTNVDIGRTMVSEVYKKSIDYESLLKFTRILFSVEERTFRRMMERVISARYNSVPKSVLFCNNQKIQDMFTRKLASLGIDPKNS